MSAAHTHTQNNETSARRIATLCHRTHECVHHDRQHSSSNSVGPISNRPQISNLPCVGTVVFCLDMMRIIGVLMVVASALRAAAPSPETYFGFRIGTDKKLVRYDKMVDYLQKVASESDRVRARTLGPTTAGNPFLLLEISSAENLKNLDHSKQIERKLYFQGGAPSATRSFAAAKPSSSSQTTSIRPRSDRRRWFLRPFIGWQPTTRRRSTRFYPR